LFDESKQRWEDSPVGVDAVNALEETHLAWYATNANISLLKPPMGDTPSIQVIFPDNTTATTSVPDFTGYHLTQGAFDGAEIDVDIGDGSFGHFLNSIDNVSAPADWSWYWELHTWNDTSSEWEDAQVGMDGIDQPMAIAWASNNTSNDAIPLPGFAVIEDSECNGHGWIMGSGSRAHCMCDAGYEWAEDDMLACIPVESEPEYTVGHFAYTYILDEDKKPRVRYVDDSWLASDFVADVVELAEREQQEQSNPFNDLVEAPVDAVAQEFADLLDGKKAETKPEKKSAFGGDLSKKEKQAATNDLDDEIPF
jgi:hypothetical protein